MTDLPHLAGLLYGTSLLADERKLHEILPLFNRRLRGERIDDYQEGGRGNGGDISITSGIAVIPVIGSLIRRSAGMDMFSGRTSYGDISESLRCAMADDRAKAILFQLDSFGGEAAGCFELCDLIFEARKTKKIWGVGDVFALSAGYAILSQCERIFMAPSGQGGSIGACSVHRDTSRLNDAMGIDYTIIRAGLRKAEYNSLEPLTKAAFEKVAASLEKTRATFVKIVVRSRPGLNTRAVRATEAQWFDADECLARSLIDAIGTYSDAFSELARSVASADAIQPPPTPTAPDTDEAEEDEDQLQETAMPPLGDPGNPAPPAPALAADPPANPAPPATAPAPVPRETSAEPTVVALDDARARGRADYAAEVAEIGQLCSIAKMPQLAAEFIGKQMTVQAVRQALIDKQAADDTQLGAFSNIRPPGNGGLAGANFGTVADPKLVADWNTAFDRALGKL